MLLVRMGNKIHLANKRKSAWVIGTARHEFNTPACNTKKQHYEFAGFPVSFEGNEKEITCKKCLSKINKKTDITLIKELLKGAKLYHEALIILNRAENEGKITQEQTNRLLDAEKEKYNIK